MNIFEKIELFKSKLIEFRLSETEEKKQTLIALRDSILNTPPDVSMIETRQGIGYITISVFESLLNNLFDPFGWSFEVTDTRIVANEYVVTGLLSVTCPITSRVMKRAGIAASQIRMKDAQNVTQIEKKIINAMEMDAPHAKSDCLKNAASSLGKLFGSDLNRKNGSSTSTELNAKARLKKIPTIVQNQIAPPNEQAMILSNEWLSVMNETVLKIDDGREVLHVLSIINQDNDRLKDFLGVPLNKNQEQIVKGAKFLTKEAKAEFWEIAKTHYSQLNAE